MIAEAIKTLREIYREGSTAQHVPVPGLHNADVFTHAGEFKTFEHTPLPRRHTVHRLEDLAAWTQPLRAADAEPVTWVDIRRVVTVLDDDSLRRNLVTLPLTFHEKFQALLTVDEREFNQRQLVDFLRTTFKDELDRDSPGLLAALRNLRMSSSQNRSSIAEQGRDELGLDVRNEVTGAGELPEDFLLMVPFWDSLDFKVVVRVALVIDAANGEFELKPLSGEIQAARLAALDWLEEMVSELCAGEIYAGTP